MKHLFNKLSAFLVMLMCMSATVQAEVVHHTVCQPTASTLGFTQECWENTVTNKFYKNESCTLELTGAELAKAVVYAKLPSNPISGNSEFDVVEFDNTQTWGVNLNWAAETTFSNAYTAWSSTPRYAEFTVACDNVEDARLVWIKNQGAVEQGKYTIKIYINGIVNASIVQEQTLEGVFVQSLSGLKKGDVVKFEVAQNAQATYSSANPTFKASLEYTGTFENAVDYTSYIIHHAVCEPTASARGFKNPCYENIFTGKYYSDANCTQEITDEALAKTVIYAKLPESPMVSSPSNSFTLSEHENVGDVDFYWAAKTTFSSGSSTYRSVIFKVKNENFAHARLVWNKNSTNRSYGTYTVSIWVNNVRLYNKVFESESEKVFVQLLPELKPDDEVKFEVTQDHVPTVSYNIPTFMASLEYEWHTHDFQANEYVCDKCGLIKAHSHNYENNVCTLCGAKHYGVCNATLYSRGFTRECWEDVRTGKFYSDANLSNEFSDSDKALYIKYVKLPENPVTQTSCFSPKESESTSITNLTLNWAAVATYYETMDDFEGENEPETRFAEFTVKEDNPDNTRLILYVDTKNNKSTYSVYIYVNGRLVYRDEEQRSDLLKGFTTISLLGIKKSDVVKVEVTRNHQEPTNYNAVTYFKASLEYTCICAHEYPEGSAICRKCGEIKAHAHSYANHECTLCGAIEPGFMVGYVGADSDRKNIMWVLNESTNVLTFTGTGEMEDFKLANNAWRNSYKTTVTKVVIGEGITTIGDGSYPHGYFIEMSGLTEVTLPSTLKTIGSAGFQDCINLASITLPEGMETIKANGIRNCKKITSVTLPSTLTTIGSEAFADCSGLRDVYIAGGEHISTASNAFNYITTGNITLHVNGDLYDWAKTTAPWSGFNIPRPYNIVVKNLEGVRQEVKLNTEASDNTWTLTDGAYKSLAILEDIPMQTLTYTRNFSAANTWQALYVPFVMQYSDWADRFDVAAINNFHEYTNANGETERIELEVRYVKSGKLRANIPYLIRAKEAGEQSIMLNDVTLKATASNSVACSSTERKYTFTGTYDAIDGLQTKDYIFVSGGKLCKANNDADVLKPMRWYLTIENYDHMTDMSSPALAKPMSIRVIGEDEATGVEEVKVVSTPLETAKSGIYSITGAKLAKPQHGINIINGNKVVIK